MQIRKYKVEDAKIIVSWIKSVRELRLWSANVYEKDKIDEFDINSNYEAQVTTGRFFPLTFEDDGEVIAHCTLRYPNKSRNDELRLGFVILSPTLRGKGYGKKIVKEAIKYAKENFNVSVITLGVFIENLSAYHTYKSVGFKEKSIEKNSFPFEDEKWDYAEMELKLGVEKND